MATATTNLDPAGRIVPAGPGHLDLGNGAYSADVHLDLDQRALETGTDTVAELHLGLSHHDPEVGEDIADVAAVAIELTRGDIVALIEGLQTLLVSVDNQAWLSGMVERFGTGPA